MSALAGTISAPIVTRVDAIAVGRWLRATLSLLVAIGILAIALPVAFGNGARGVGVEPVQVFSSGSLVAVEASGGAQLSIGGMVPGESRSATVRVANGGTAPAIFSLASHIVDSIGAGGAGLSEALILRIEPSAGAVLYRGPIGDLPRLSLGRIDAGGERAYRFSVVLPAGVGNEVEGSSLSAGFSWNAA